MPIIKPDWLRFWLTFVAQRFFMLPLVWLVFRVFNHVKVEGLEQLDAVEGGSIILAPNHTTAWDGWVGTVWALSARKRFIDRESYLAVLAAPENIPTLPLKLLVALLGAIPVDRERGVEQPALLDLVRIMRERRQKVVVTIYPEGTRSRENGRLRQRRARPGVGWLALRSGAPVVPIYHVGGRQMPGLGLKMKVRVGRPITFERFRELPDELATWRAASEAVMDELRRLEREELGEEPQPPRKRWLFRRRTQERETVGAR